ncbi:hypothetical protein V2J09_020175 [Rumex salicifolius]
MESNNNQSFQQFSDHLRLQNSDSLNDSVWSFNNGNFDIRVGGGLSQINNNNNTVGAPNPSNNNQNSEFNTFNDGWRIELNLSAQSIVNGAYSKPYTNQVYNKILGGGKKKKKDEINKNSVDKRFKTLPAAEALPKNETIGGYIFVCNNDTMEENLKRQLFGLPPRFRDRVRAITPGLLLFLYNYSTHQLHGIFEANSSIPI